MRLRSLAVAVPLVLVLSACGGGEAETGAAPTPEEAAIEETQEAEPVAATPDSGEMEPCFTVAEIGRMTLTWDLVVAARGASDQPDHIEDLSDEMFEMVLDVYGKDCSGAEEVSLMYAELGLLESDVEIGVDTDERYEMVAEHGNDLIDLSADAGHEWDYEFISDVSEIDY